MALSIGATLGPYEVVGALGAGGMGEVYRARDAKLNRDVALKILPARFALDPDRLARFKREAQVLASLNHPNIAAIYGFEDSSDVHALVLELVDGPTLADRIARAPVPLDEALPIARQICEALEAAHERGIIHRDLKPANVKVRPDGTVKVLDFGLAKALDPNIATDPDVTASPTMASPAMTGSGVILGTAAYMAPEQARGKPVDERSDIWAFGCVLYELLTGQRAIRGATMSDVLVAILERDPDWTALPAATPPAIRRLLRRCMEKDPKRRLRDTGDARAEIEEAQATPAPQRGEGSEPRSARTWSRLGWVAALAALVVLTAAVLAVRVLRTAPSGPEMRLEISTPPSRDPSLEISPDGLKIVFVARSAGVSQLWLRSLDAPLARPLAGTERATSPFWSPDSRSIGFFADTKLKRMELDGGSVRTLASGTPAANGGAWNSGGTIIFAPGNGTPILRISAEGGEPAAVTRFQSPQQRSQGSARFLPDGRHFLFFVSGSAEARGVYIGQLDGLDARRLFDADAPAVYASTGHLLLVREGRLLAWAFDPVRLELTGAPFPIGEHVNGGTALSASAAGPIVYRTPSADSGQRQFVWVDRSGRAIDTVIYPDTAPSQGPALSHDGRRIALYRYANGNMDIWHYETGRRTWDRITFDSAGEVGPVWSPDDRQLVFSSNRKGGRMNLYRKVLGAPPGSEELLLATPEVKVAMDWSPDGRFLLYNSINPKSGSDIWALPLEGDKKPFEVVQTDFNEIPSQFSPDGKWIAYASDKTGRFEIYVQPFPGPGGGSPVSTNGGGGARWNPNGKELFYMADDRLMAVPIRFGSNGKTVELGAPLALFATLGRAAANTNGQPYMVSPDGQSFVMNSGLDEASTSPITVILNWKPKP